MTRDVVTAECDTAGTIPVSGGFSAVPVVDADDRLREPARGLGALREDEQRIWDETVCDHESEAGEALPAVVVGGSWGAVLLVLFGVPMAAWPSGRRRAWRGWSGAFGAADLARPDRPVRDEVIRTVQVFREGTADIEP